MIDEVGSGGAGPRLAHRLFEDQASRRADATAIVAGTRVVSYRELDSRANALAHRLIAQGVTPGTLVGLLAGRSVEMVVGILGILKAGAAYVPLHVEYPLERLAFQVQDADLPFVVAAPGFEGLAAKLGAPVLAFPGESEHSAAPPHLDDTPDALAYVIYTSGSTGQPKGVGLRHQGLVSLIAFSREQMQIGPGDRVLQFASFSFDASLWEILVALASGAALVLGTTDELKPGPSLHTLMKAQRVTIALLSPSVLQILPPQGLDTLRILVAGTEKLTGAIVSRWQSRGRRFFNAYGPTEATIYQLIWEAPDGPPPDTPPIGTPTPGVEAYLLDDDLRPVPDGASGELCLAGPCVGCGYIGRPELTRERFVVAPLGENGEGVRIYRTGDRARRLPDGAYEFQGRLDLQVKVRGFRVEPGEIEAALDRHPNVASSAVVAAPDGSGLMRLWAYFVAAGERVPPPAELKSFLAARLPEYMLPLGFIVLSRWPLNANGKLDRGRLPEPGLRASEGAPEQRPLTSTEDRLLDWCREIVGWPELGPDDSLPDAGFHSLALAQLLWKMEDGFGVSPSFTELFARPRVAELASWVDAQGADEGVQRADRVARGLPRVDTHREHPPLSSAQQRVWFLEQLHPGNNAYRFQSIVEFHGRLDVAALEGALDRIVQRHEILRTTFPSRGGQPFQQIHAHEPVSLPVEESTASSARAEIEQTIREPFDLARLPLVRWRLFRISPEEHWLLHTEHHLLHDGWGYGAFLKELFAAYDALSAGREPDLPLLPAQFADLAAWQQRQVESGAWEEQLVYWERSLSGAEAPLRLPGDQPPPQEQTFAGDQIRTSLDRGLYTELLAACSREQVTPYMWLHAAFQAFVHRYTGQTDVVVGSGIANRRRSESKLLLGMMINTVALRTSFAGDPTFRDVLARFRRTVAAAMDHQDAPYDRVVQRLQSASHGAGASAGTGTGTDLFRCFFDSYDQSFPQYCNERVRAVTIDGIGNGTSKFDLTALVIPGDGAPTLLWEYSTDLFARATAERMMGHFLALVEASVATPDLPVSRLRLLSASERRHLLELGRGPQTVAPGERIELVFADQVAARPDDEALICGAERLSYAELDRAAGELADRLRIAGVVPGGVVAISLPRGTGAIVAMLAVLRCGCAYMPLDPALPAARRSLLLDAVAPLATVTVDGVIAGKERTGTAAASPAGDAYVLFTSGSTGIPKAVFAPHRAVIRLVCGVPYVRLEEATRMLQLAPLSFDGSTFEIWGALLNGGTLVVHAEELPELTGLSRTIAGESVNTAFLTTSLFHRVVDTAPEILRPIAQLVVGGETLSPRHVARARRELPRTKLVNGYGPTESTTFATTFTLPRNVSQSFGDSSARVPIGVPLPRTQVHVLDEHLEIQPIGVAGELYIGGDGLGRYSDDRLQQARFVPDPFAPRSGSLLYRTGDRARWLADGTLDFLERIDRQVKIHGYRIEPAEIEAVLARHEDVREVAVLASADAAGERKLVAYLVLAPGADPRAVEAVRELASGFLPSYMVPAGFVRVPELPLSAQGKLDTELLEQMAAAPPATGREATGAPQTPLEAVVAGVWAQVLGIESPVVDDNFFDVGGHSLLALQLIHELNTALGVELPVRLIFTDPTIGGIARIIETELAARFGRTRRYAPLVPLKPGGDLPPFFLVAGGVGGENELIVYAGLARYLDPRRPFFGLRARGVDEVVEPHSSVEEMAAEYLRRIRGVQPEGPYTIGGACIAGVVALEMAQQLRRDQQEVRRLVLLDSSIPRWSRYMRNELVRLWSDLVRPDLEQARASGVVKIASEWRRRMRNPSPDEQIAYRRLRIMRTYLARLTAYKPQPYAGDVALLRAAETNEREMGRWRSIAIGRFEMYEVPGDHFSHLREHARATVNQLEACLAAVESP